MSDALSRQDDGGVRWGWMIVTVPYVAVAILVIRARIRAEEAAGRIWLWLGWA